MAVSDSFTTIGKGHGAPCQPATRDDWEHLRKQSWLEQMCGRIKNGDDDLKHRLPVWTPHCAEFKNNHRSIADAVRPLNRLMMDFDEKGHTDEIKARLMEKSPLEVLLIEESVRGGTHVLVSLPSGMQAEDAQQLIKEVTGFVPDAAVKDVSRCIYMVPESHTRYVSEKLFDVGEREKSSMVNGQCSTVNVQSSMVNGQSSMVNAQCSMFNVQCFKGIPYADIISEWWKRNGGEPEQGERNVKLHKLAVNLRAICDNNRDVLMAVMPRCGLSDAELRSIVDSACKELPKGVSKALSGIIEELEERAEICDDDDECVADESTGMKLRYLPIGLRQSLAGVPSTMHMPVLCSVLPIAAAYADQVEVEYCDGMRQRLGLMSIIRGEQASGKSVCKLAVDIWKRQFEKEDALAREVEDKWRERKKGRKANEKAPDDPRVLIRMMPVTVSCSTLLRRLKNAQGHCLYSFGEELDTLRKTNGAGSWSAKYDIYRVAFDNGEWGQDYNSDQAESGVVRVAYNWTVLGTDGALRKCFKQDNIENGLSSRVLVSEMPDASFQKMPKYGKRTTDDEKKIDEAVTRLRNCSGFIDTPLLRRAIEKWVEEKRVEAAKDIDRVKDTYRRRAAVIGFRCGVIFHLLTGKERETKRCIDFARMMAEYTLNQQISAFGEALQNQFNEGIVESKRGINNNVFDQLPTTFTIDDLRILRRGNLADRSLRVIISRWRRDGWIEKIDLTHWKKITL